GYQWLKDKILSEEGRRQQAKLKELQAIAERLGCTLPQLAIDLVEDYMRPTGRRYRAAVPEDWVLVRGEEGRCFPKLAIGTPRHSAALSLSVCLSVPSDSTTNYLLLVLLLLLLYYYYYYYLPPPLHSCYPPPRCSDGRT
ncbi:hypothetical protein CRUP_010908, partial [Coryphaenoides rupestris]